jgi:ubiquinone/menaquinone biosynthesis C-methylase UbiE/archaellum component FlaC
LHRYALAFGLAKRKRVLDIACGEGYGANLLALAASKVTGVDRDGSTIAHAKAKYRRRNLHFVRGTCSKIPCRDHSMDLVASFETIEHISEHEQFLSEIKRVLAPGGILIISSPHKAEYREVSEAANPFHETELDHDEFVQLITKTFKHCVAARQRLVVGSWIAPDAPSARVSTATFRGWFDGIEIERGVYRGIYSIAVCSDRVLPIFELGMFENFRDSAETWNLLDTCDTPAELSAKLLELGRAGEEQTKHLVLLQGELKEKSEQAVHFRQELEEKSSQVAHLQRECDQHSQLLERLKNQLEISCDQLTRARARFLALENRIETLTSLQNDFEQEQITGQSKQDELRAELEATIEDLRSSQKQMDLLRDSLSHKLILPVGGSQRKLQQLTPGRRADD